MRSRTPGAFAAGLLTLSLITAPTAASADSAPDCLTVPGNAGAAIDANIAGYPVEKPSEYRTVDGRKEPVYRVKIGQTLHIPTRITNSGTCHYWTFGGDLTAIGHDAFKTPGSSTYVEGIGNRIWAASIGVPTWDPDPDRNHPYTRRSERLYVEVSPGDTAKRLWPITVDNLPRAGVLYGVRFRYDTDVSDPPVSDNATSKRIWLVRD
ncbi:hypothetical protein RWH45_00785 [Microbacterium sp. KSW4-17]|uniref:Uncharacterized protein n=1 Tax=Microbacterium galbum TaxID=3075994 RepID=A0ABU3T338_9MICO|nr:hypothetical protein [Microbacterium sp. KSW4-17]MDU0365726.1 hypothetical protein [Microbacterium sp. KSW4-17]